MNSRAFYAILSVNILFIGGSGFVLSSQIGSIRGHSDKEVIHISGAIANKTKQDLIVDSDLIIRGVVNRSLPSKWSNPIGKFKARNIIQTDISIEIDEVFKGKPYDNRNIVVRVDKGEVEDAVVESNGYPDFHEGENVLLFLSKDDSDLAEAKPTEYYYVLTGMLQGKFEYLFEDRDGDELGKHSYANVHLERIDLDEFRYEIENTIATKKPSREKWDRAGIKAENEKLFRGGSPNNFSAPTTTDLPR